MPTMVINIPAELYEQLEVQPAKLERPRKH